MLEFNVVFQKVKTIFRQTLIICGNLNNVFICKKRIQSYIKEARLFRHSLTLSSASLQVSYD